MTYGDAAHLVRLCAAADALIGTEVFALNDAAARVTRALAADTTTSGHGMSGMLTGSSTVDRVMSRSVALLDIQGKGVGRPVSDLLGGGFATGSGTSAISSTSGRAIPALPRTSGAPRSIRRASCGRPPP